MARWAIGDVQGCYDELAALIDKIDAVDAQASFWLCGDLINRGPKNRATLDLVQSLAKAGRLQTVLGNHDVFALACAAGITQAKPEKGDTLDELLTGEQRWVDWLRQQPLALHDDGFLLTHAGVWPAWGVAYCLAQAAQIEAALRSDDWQAQLRRLWLPTAHDWDRHGDAISQGRFAINALLRMRYLNAQGQLDLSLKETGANNAPAGYTPWFAANPRAAREAVLVFGHWSALGLMNTERFIGLDTGCVWGGALSAVRLAHKVDERVLLQVARRSATQT